MALLLFCCVLLAVPNDNPSASPGSVEGGSRVAADSGKTIEAPGWVPDWFWRGFTLKQRGRKSEVLWGRHRKSLATWIAQLDDENEDHREEAACVLGEMGPKAAQAIPALIRTLKSRKPLTSPHIGGTFTFVDRAPAEARDALVGIGPAAIPALTEALKHADGLTRVNAAWALWKLEKCTDKVLPVLVAAWKDNALFRVDECIRIDASDALGEIGQRQPGKVLPILLKALDGEDEWVACAALRALGVMAQQEKEAVGVLVGRLDDRRGNLADFAADCLWEVGQAAVPALVAALDDPNASVRERAARALGNMRLREVGKALLALKKATHDPDEAVRERAVWALKRVGQ